jgi:hypothetical protein
VFEAWDMGYVGLVRLDRVLLGRENLAPTQDPDTKVKKSRGEVRSNISAALDVQTQRGEYCGIQGSVMRLW